MCVYNCSYLSAPGCHEPMRLFPFLRLFIFPINLALFGSFLVCCPNIASWRLQIPVVAVLLMGAAAMAGSSMALSDAPFFCNQPLRAHSTARQPWNQFASMVPTETGFWWASSVDLAGLALWASLRGRCY